jgi:hypothetical protein
MEHACVNPYCSCQNCKCEPPCTCGLVKVEHLTDEAWDAGTQELRYTVTSRYRHQPGPARRARGGDESAEHDHGHDHDGEPDAPGVGDPEELLAESLGDATRQASVLASRRAASPTEHPHEHASVRTAEHNGHTIEIRTTYDVRIDGEPLEAHIGVGNDGNVHYHGLPNYTEASAVDLMRRVIDAFPDDYPPRAGHESGAE